jgi:hypothetical protein
MAPERHIPAQDCTRIAPFAHGVGCDVRKRKVIRSDGKRWVASAPSADARVVAVALLLIIGLCSGAVSHAAAQPYKDRQVVEVLRDFQRQGVRVIFSTGLVTPDMRVGVEPHGAKPGDVITAILAPHDLRLRVGLRGILLVVSAASVVDPNDRTRSATNTKNGVIVGTVRDRSTRRPIPAAAVRVEGIALRALTRDDGQFRLAMVPTGVRTLIAQAPGYEPLVSEVSVSPGRTAMVVFQLVRGQPDGRVRTSDRRLAVPLVGGIASKRRGGLGSGSTVPAEGTRRQSRIPQSPFIKKECPQCVDSPTSEVSSPS